GLEAGGRELAARALGSARRAGDSFALVTALTTSVVSLFGTDQAEERLQLADELLLPGRIADPNWAAFVAGLRGITLLELGDREGSDAVLSELTRKSQQLVWWASRSMIGHYRGIHEVLDGRFQEAENAGWDPGFQAAALAWIGRLHRPPAEVLPILDPANCRSAAGVHGQLRA